MRPDEEQQNCPCRSFDVNLNWVSQNIQLNRFWELNKGKKYHAFPRKTYCNV